ncbi:hypothetical protein AYL99_03698 [Fonsecaea erecta]|uniref:Uncharacterized protein n=1 Tax=Fonsecaea erecta TaxID=1367422 RepID=A0A178ZR71_9EURO|nr:hypothetical protein AYL99_03698 [Fonsecaea erecta]OAP61495.1 hypothetical protein AYL99_03698 [Fonsecaea erecta]
MPPNKKKNRRNRVATQNQDQSLPPPKTVPCPRCHEEIIVPKTCKHGKKLINCQGTGCTTAHIDEHNEHCQPVAPSRPATSGPANTPPEFSGPTLITGPWVTGPPNAQLSAALRTFNSMHTVALGELSFQLTNLMTRRGKYAKYVDGMPVTEWFHKVEDGSVQLVNQWTEKLRKVNNGEQTVEEIGYDDDESEDLGDECATPSEDE